SFELLLDLKRNSTNKDSEKRDTCDHSRQQKKTKNLEYGVNLIPRPNRTKYQATQLPNDVIIRYKKVGKEEEAIQH
ncbi:hypothetical protein L9F63_023269, partial [Diploptera punctata]